MTSKGKDVIALAAYGIFVAIVILLASFFYRYFDAHRAHDTDTVENWSHGIRTPAKPQKSFEDGVDVSKLLKEKSKALNSGPLPIDQAMKLYVQKANHQ